MKMREKQIFLAALAMALSMIVGGCERHEKSEHYFLIATNINLTLLAVGTRRIHQGRRAVRRYRRHARARYLQSCNRSG